MTCIIPRTHFLSHYVYMHPGQHEMNYPFNIHEGFNKISDRLWLFEHKLFLNNLYNIA